MEQVELPHLTLACLASDKGEQGSVALVMTTGKHGLIPKSAPIRFTAAALHRAVHTVPLSGTKVLSTAVPPVQQSIRWGTLQAGGRGSVTLECRHCLATYYYLISNFFPLLELVPRLLHQLHSFVLQWLNHLWLVKNVFACAYSQNPYSHRTPMRASFVLGKFCAQ